MGFVNPGEKSNPIGAQVGSREGIAGSESGVRNGVCKMEWDPGWGITDRAACTMVRSPFN